MLLFICIMILNVSCCNNIFNSEVFELKVSIAFIPSTLCYSRFSRAIDLSLLNGLVFLKFSIYLCTVLNIQLRVNSFGFIDCSNSKLLHSGIVIILPSADLTIFMVSWKFNSFNKWSGLRWYNSMICIGFVRMLWKGWLKAQTS